MAQTLNHAEIVERAVWKNKCFYSLDQGKAFNLTAKCVRKLSFFEKKFLTLYTMLYGFYFLRILKVS